MAGARHAQLSSKCISPAEGSANPHGLDEDIVSSTSATSTTQMPATSATDNDVFLFLDLAPELRNTIYEETFAIHPDHLEGFVDITTPFPTITQANQKIRSECYDMYLSSTSFLAVVTADPATYDRILEWINMLGATDIRKIKSLAIVCDELPWPEREGGLSTLFPIWSKWTEFAINLMRSGIRAEQLHWTGPQRAMTSIISAGDRAAAYIMLSARAAFLMAVPGRLMGGNILEQQRRTDLGEDGQHGNNNGNGIDEDVGGVQNTDDRDSDDDKANRASSSASSENAAVAHTQNEPPTLNASPKPLKPNAVAMQENFESSNAIINGLRDSDHNIAVTTRLFVDFWRDDVWINWLVKEVHPILEEAFAALESGGVEEFRAVENAEWAVVVMRCQRGLPWAG